MKTTAPRATKHQQQLSSTRLAGATLCVVFGLVITAMAGEHPKQSMLNANVTEQDSKHIFHNEVFFVHSTQNTL